MKTKLFLITAIIALLQLNGFAQCNFTTAISAIGPTAACAGASVNQTLTALTPTGNTWTQKANFGSIGRENPVAFGIGCKGYFGTGHDGTGGKNDFWEYDPATNVWTQKANLAGPGRDGAVGFSIGNKGYIGTGGGSALYNDFYEYDPTANTWTQKANFGGTARYGAVGFNVGTKGYVGTGSDANNLKNDFWEYNPATNTWTQKANFGGAIREYATGFGMATKGYIGCGSGASTYNDFWEYDQANNTWTQKANFGGTARWLTASFAIGNRGYIGTGEDNSSTGDFWEYNPTSNSWTAISTFSGATRSAATGFSIGEKGYITNGFNGSSRKTDLWEYTPVNTYSWSNGATTQSTTVSSGNSHTLYIISVTGYSTSATQTILVYPSPTLTVSSSIPDLCIGQTATITAGSATNYTWSTGGNTNSIVVSPTVPTSYTVITTDNNNCTGSTVFTQSVSACTSLSQLVTLNSQLSVYPNPSEGNFTLELNENAQIDIYNTMGQKVFSQTLEAGKQNIELNGEAKGIYSLKATQHSHTITMRVIIK